MPKSCLLVGNERPTLAVAESLKRAGYHVIVGMRGGECRADLSRYVDEAWEPKASGAAGRAALVERLRQRPDVRYVFPVCQPDVVWFAENSYALPESVTVVAPAADLVATCVDKTALFEAAAQAQASIPAWMEVENWQGMVEAADAVGYPCVVKPTDGPLLGEKALICDTPAVLRSKLSRWPEGHPRLIVQRRALGPRHNVYFTAHHGDLLDHLEVRILRTHRPDGTGLAVEGVTVAPNSELTETTKRLVRRLAFTGVGCAQFLVDPRTGKANFLEINSRLGANTAIACRAGLDLPLAAVQLALGQRPKFDSANFKIGLRYSWIYGEVSGFVRAMITRQLNPAQACRWMWRAVLSMARADFDLVWSASDPLPTLGVLGAALRESFEFSWTRIRPPASRPRVTAPSVGRH